MANDNKLSERALKRLRIAARLMRRTGAGEPELGVQQCVELLERILRMPQASRDRLRSQVDWVEDYDRVQAEQERSGELVRDGTPTRPPSGRCPSARAARRRGRS